MDKVTMSQVAEAAGVNKATVSRALRGDRRISEATHARVWAAARRLGYERNALASGLSSRHSGVVGLVLASLRPSWTGALISGVSRVLARARVDLLISSIDGNGRGASTVLRRMTSRRVDGLLWLGPWADGETVDVPAVFLGDGAPLGGCQIGTDREELLRQVRTLANGRPILYRQGPNASFCFLEELAAADGAAEGAPLVIWDGLSSPIEGERPELACVPQGAWDWNAPWRVELPAAELGVLSGRLLLNCVFGRGCRPAKVSVRPNLVSRVGTSEAEGDVG